MPKRIIYKVQSNSDEKRVDSRKTTFDVMVWLAGKKDSSLKKLE